jgi:hypothetical protein
MRGCLWGLWLLTATIIAGRAARDWRDPDEDRAVVLAAAACFALALGIWALLLVLVP